MKIVFFGTSHFSAAILGHLVSDTTNQVVAVITQPDKPVGRKQELTESPVALMAGSLALTTMKPLTLKNEEIASSLRDLSPEVYVVVAYGKIIPEKILAIPSIAPINIHLSLLPKYRGASPIQKAIQNDEKETGVTTMIMDKDIDHGPMLFKKAVSILPQDTLVEVESNLLEVAKELITETLLNIKGIRPIAQEHGQATFTKIITKADGEVAWNSSAQEIYNQYRALIVWPGIWTTYNGKLLKIKKCQPVLSTTLAPGLVGLVEEKVLVGTKLGSLELLEVQIEGKTRVGVQDFLKGHQDFIGSKLVEIKLG